MTTACKKKLIIDTDGCSDDAMAIMMALKDERYQVEMISTVDGGVSTKQAALNVLVVEEYAKTYYPPVYEGATKSFLRSERHGIASLHGKDGMGDLFLAPKKLKIKKENGVDKILETLKNNKAKTIKIIALGPLTNIALAIMNDPKTMARVKEIDIMGTGGLGLGNVTPAAECNIWQDPIATQIVLESNLPLMFVGWDACRGDAFLHEEEIDRIANSGKLGKLAIDCNRLMIDLNVKRMNKRWIDLADVAAMAAALEPSVIDTCDKYYLNCDTSGGISDGAVLVDVLGTTGKDPNAYVCSKLKADKYKEYILKLFEA